MNFWKQAGSFCPQLCPERKSKRSRLGGCSVQLPARRLNGSNDRASGAHNEKEEEDQSMNIGPNQPSGGPSGPGGRRNRRRRMRRGPAPNANPNQNRGNNSQPGGQQRKGTGQPAGEQSARPGQNRHRQNRGRPAFTGPIDHSYRNGPPEHGASR